MCLLLKTSPIISNRKTLCIKSKPCKTQDLLCHTKQRIVVSRKKFRMKEIRKKYLWTRYSAFKFLNPHFDLKIQRAFNVAEFSMILNYLVIQFQSSSLLSIGFPPFLVHIEKSMHVYFRVLRVLEVDVILQAWMLLIWVMNVIFKNCPSVCPDQLQRHDILQHLISPCKWICDMHTILILTYCWVLADAHCQIKRLCLVKCPIMPLLKYHWICIRWRTTASNWYMLEQPYLLCVVKKFQGSGDLQNKLLQV